MPIQILMPALSPTMTEGTVASWVKTEGEEVSSGDVLCEIETDKATMEVEAIEDGVLGKIIVAAGTENVAVNSPIGIILEDGEDASALDSIKKTTPINLQNKENAAKQVSEQKSLLAATAIQSEVIGETPSNNERTFASPLAKRLAIQNGIELSLLTGSGPRGRIVRRDIEAANANKPIEPNSTSTASSLAPPSAANITFAEDPVTVSMPEYVAIPHSSMRRTIAERLTESARDIPHFNIYMDVEIDELLHIRNQLNGRDDTKHKISINDIVIKSVALALELQPNCNVAFMEKAILQFKQVDIAIAVAVDGGLITPIIKDAGGKGLRAISEAAIELARKAREGKLQPDEYQGGTFTISNLGMFGVKSFNSIINSPQGGILSVGAGEQRPVVKNDALAIATMMSLTLAFDHRCIDGATAAAFAKELKGILECPLQLML